MKSVGFWIEAVSDCAVFATAAMSLKLPHSVNVYEEPAVTTSGFVVVAAAKLHVFTKPDTDDDARLSVATISLPLGSFNTTDAKNPVDVAVLLNVRFKLLSLLSPALFEVKVIEPICWVLAGGKLPTEEPDTANVLLKVVWGLPVAFERVVIAVLFEVAPRATTAKAVVLLVESVVVAISKVEVVLSVNEPLVNDPASPLRVSETEEPCGTINGLVKLLNT